MGKTIVQINFTYNIPKEEYLAMAEQAAQQIANVEGCLWKIWLLNEETRGAGGIYLFESAEAAQAYGNGPIVAQLSGHPGLSDMSVRVYGYAEGPTKVTRGPVND